MTSRQKIAERLWRELTSREQGSSTNTATELRQANTGGLRQAKLDKEVGERARVTLTLAKNGRHKAS